MKIATSYYSSPVGLLLIEANDDSIVVLSFEEKKEKREEPSKLTEKCVRQLEEYFSGKRKSFELPLAPNGTLFQKQVWSQLQKIPFAKTISYLKLAKELGDARKGSRCQRARSQETG